MANIINKLKNLFRTAGQPATGSSGAETTPKTAVFTETAVLQLMDTLDQTDPHMYDCETTYALLDEYVDLVSSDAEKAALMPLVQKHLEACPDCRAKFEILISILKTTD